MTRQQGTPTPRLSNAQARAKSALRQAHPVEYREIREEMRARRDRGEPIGDFSAAAGTELVRRHPAEYRFRYLAAKG